MKKLNGKLMGFSMILSLASGLILPAEKIRENMYVMGYPIKYMRYSSRQGMVYPRIAMFLPKNILNISVNLLDFLFCSLAIYLFLFIIYLVVKRIVE